MDVAALLGLPQELPCMGAVLLPAWTQLQ
jgi:hypothetical protein